MCSVCSVCSVQCAVRRERGPSPCSPSPPPPPPLSLRSTAAPCEQPTLAAYFRNLLSTPCIRISNLENWKCFNGASNAPTIGATQAIVTLIILAWFGAYWYHMKLYGGHGLDLLVPLAKDVPVLGPFLVKHFGSPGGSSGAVELK